MIERRNVTTEVRSDGGKIVGLASPVYDGLPDTEYTLWEGCAERFAAGAFDEHLKGNPDVVALFNHDPSLVLGRTPSTLTLKTDKRGLHYEINPPETQVAKDLLISISRGDIRGSSFAFSASEVEWQEDGGKDIRLIRKAKVFDVSPVTYPAYGGSNVGLRSEDRASLEKERNDFKARLETERRLAKLQQLMRK